MRLSWASSGTIGVFGISESGNKLSCPDNAGLHAYIDHAYDVNEMKATEHRLCEAMLAIIDLKLPSKSSNAQSSAACAEATTALSTNGA